MIQGTLVSLVGNEKLGMIVMCSSRAKKSICNIDVSKLHVTISLIKIHVMYTSIALKEQGKPILNTVPVTLICAREPQDCTRPVSSSITVHQQNNVPFVSHKSLYIIKHHRTSRGVNNNFS